jgi:hypothetical protein
VGVLRFWLLLVLVGGAIPQSLTDGPDPTYSGSRFSFEAEAGTTMADPPGDDDLSDDDDDDDDDHHHVGHLPPRPPLAVALTATRLLRRHEAALLPSSVDADPPLHVPRA